MKRTLSLRRETIGELAARDLAQVVGAALPTSPLKDCLDLVRITERSGSDCTCPTE